MRSTKYFGMMLLLLFIGCKNNTAKIESLQTINDLEDLNNAIESSPLVDSLFYLRADWYFTHLEYKKAISDLQFAIKLDSLVPSYYHLLADAYIDNNQSYEALTTMRKAGDLFKDRIPTLLKLSEFQNILKQYDGSLNTTLKILNIDPLNAEAYLMSAINYRDLNDTVNAIKSLQKATVYNDQMIDAWILLGKLTKKSDNTYSRMCIENALKLDSTSSNTLHAIAEYYQEDKPLVSIKYYKKIIGNDPDYIEAIDNAGILYFSIDSFSQALSHFNLACEKNPTQAIYYYQRGTAKEALGDKEGAGQDYNSALNLDPKNADYLKAANSLK